MAFLAAQAEPKTEKSQINDLIARVAAGDSDGFEQLYRLTQSSVYGFALSITKNRHDAEDVMQQTYLSVYAAAPQFVARGNGLTWMLSIAKNHALMLLRQQKRESAIDPEAIDDSNVILFPQKHTVSDERLLLNAAFSILSDEERQIIVLHAVTGLKHREIADLLKLALATVLSKYTRGLTKLKSYIEQEL